MVDLQRRLRRHEPGHLPWRSRCSERNRRRLRRNRGRGSMHRRPGSEGNVVPCRCRVSRCQWERNSDSGSLSQVVSARYQRTVQRGIHEVSGCDARSVAPRALYLAGDQGGSWRADATITFHNSGPSSAPASNDRADHAWYPTFRRWVYVEANRTCPESCTITSPAPVVLVHGMNGGGVPRRGKRSSVRRAFPFARQSVQEQQYVPEPMPWRQPGGLPHGNPTVRSDSRA